MSKNFGPFLVPVLLMFSLIPESEKRLGQLATLIEATQNAVQTLRTGVEGFQNAMVEAFMATQESAPSPSQTTAQKTSPDFLNKPAREVK